ncbi:hypothetical protein CRG98_017190 [Punica granatum]|uniref:Uncharacterized protein n=1 Tax=Punica granatum TaxID=22663 RepID=A0A2I0K1F8_PUNGR|nr:hypothetical protein CRG98_017190 [Punica granatum]
MDVSLQATVTYAVDAGSLWNDLKERYSEGNQSRVFQIKADICLLRQEGLSIREYYSKLKLLWDELEIYLEHSGCSCGAGAAMAVQRETEKCFQFLMGLTSEFNTIRSTILSIEPIPNLNKVYKMVANEERQRLVTRARESAPESAVFFVRAEAEHGQGRIGRLQGEAGERPSCEHCGKLGHTKNTCWALNGYPSSHYKSKANPGRGPGQKQVRPNSGPKGKMQAQHGPDRAHAAQTRHGSGSRAEKLEALPDDQFNRLLSLLSHDTIDPNRLDRTSRRTIGVGELQGGGLLPEASGYHTTDMPGSPRGIWGSLAPKAWSPISSDKIAWY